MNNIKNIKRANDRLEATKNKIKKEKLQIQKLQNEISREKKKARVWWSCEQDRIIREAINTSEPSSYMISFLAILMQHLFASLDDASLQKAFMTYNSKELELISHIINENTQSSEIKTRILSCIQSHLES